MEVRIYILFQLMKKVVRIMFKKKRDNICKVCGNIIANPDNKTGICPRCSKKGRTIGGTVLGVFVGGFMLVKNIIKK